MKIEGSFPFRFWVLLTKEERDRAEKTLVEVSAESLGLYEVLKHKVLSENRISNGKFLDGSLGFVSSRNETDEAEDFIDGNAFFDTEFPGIKTTWSGERPKKVLEAAITARLTVALVQKIRGYLLVKMGDLELICPLRGPAKDTTLAEALVDVERAAGGAGSLLKAVTDEIATCQMVD